jgi:hypothetical protein
MSVTVGPNGRLAHLVYEAGTPSNRFERAHPGPTAAGSPPMPNLGKTSFFDLSLSPFLTLGEVKALVPLLSPRVLHAFAMKTGRCSSQLAKQLYQLSQSMCGALQVRKTLPPGISRVRCSSLVSVLPIWRARVNYDRPS